MEEPKKITLCLNPSLEALISTKCEHFVNIPVYLFLGCPNIIDKVK